MSDRIAEAQFIAAGWETFRKTFLPTSLSPRSIEQFREAFFSGASIIFETIMVSLDGRAEKRSADIAVLTAVSAEIELFARKMDEKYLPTPGRTQ